MGTTSRASSSKQACFYTKGLLFTSKSKLFIFFVRNIVVQSKSFKQTKKLTIKIPVLSRPKIIAAIFILLHLLAAFNICTYEYVPVHVVTSKHVW